MSKYDKLGNNGAKHNGKPRVAFYTRISTDEDHQKYSLGAQNERLEAFCKAQYGDDWLLHKLYRDTESGTHMNRPGLEEMLYDAENKLFDILMVFRVDRLSRKVRELAQMVDELTKQNIALKSITEPFDTTNAAGKMMLQMLGVFAEFEHTTIVERTKVGLERKARTGRFVGGYVPFGYTLDPEKGLVINEDEALLIKKMFKMYTFGKDGAWAISNDLNLAGYRKRSGKKWDKRIILHILRNPVYIGKLRWREVLYEGNHEPLISEVVFEKAREVLDKRNEELKGRQFNNGDERLLSGIMKCAKCGSHMFGGGGKNKSGRYVPYYMCSKRFTQHECDQPYIRADILEASIIEDVKSIFRDEQLIARIWEKANSMLVTEKPDIDKEISALEDRAIKAQARIDKYFEAFEEGKLKPEVCNEKVENLNAQIRELEAKKKEFEARRKKLELPALDKEMLGKIVDNLDAVMAGGDNKKRKHLLGLLVKKVLIHDRRTIEVWYSIPNLPAQNRQAGCKPDGERFETWDIWLPDCAPSNKQNLCSAVRSTTESAPSHKLNLVEFAFMKDDAEKLPYVLRDEFGFGIIRYGSTRLLSEEALQALWESKEKEYHPPTVQTLLKTARTLQGMLETRPETTRATLARELGVTRARMTQIMGLLNLSPEIQAYILSMPPVNGRPTISERSLRPITLIESHKEQVRVFRQLAK